MQDASKPIDEEKDTRRDPLVNEENPNSSPDEYNNSGASSTLAHTLLLVLLTTIVTALGLA